MFRMDDLRWQLQECDTYIYRYIYILQMFYTKKLRKKSNKSQILCFFIVDIAVYFKHTTPTMSDPLND